MKKLDCDAIELPDGSGYYIPMGQMHTVAFRDGSVFLWFNCFEMAKFVEDARRLNFKTIHVCGKIFIEAAWFIARTDSADLIEQITCRAKNICRAMDANQRVKFTDIPDDNEEFGYTQ